MKIVFVDAYSIGKAGISQLKALGEWTAYETASPAEVVDRCTIAKTSHYQ